jgi:drug/metabolite transporter (DMT)-like permease
MYYIPILGALMLAAITISEKIALKKRKLDIKTFQTATFLSAAILMLPLVYFFWDVSPEALQTKNIIILATIIIISVFANLSIFFALKWEKVNNIEPAIIMEPLFTVILAVIFSYFTVGLFERNFNIIIPTFIAGAALIFSHIRKHHLNFNKYFLATILGSLLYSIELILTRLVLEVYSPISFYFLRCAGIFLISLMIFRPKFSEIKGKPRWEIPLIGALWVGFRILVYYGYLQLGVVFTTLIIMLGPIFVYFFAWKFLKEKLHWKNIVSAIIIVLCVLYVTVF